MEKQVEVDSFGPNECRLARVTAPPSNGLVEWWLSCPESDWFVEIDSESTDSL